MKNVTFILLTFVFLSACNKSEEAPQVVVDAQFFAQKWERLSTEEGIETYQMIENELGLEDGASGMEVSDDGTLFIWNYDVPFKFPLTDGTWTIDETAEGQFLVAMELLAWPNRNYEILELNAEKLVLKEQ